jgi:cell division protein FtsW
MKAATVLLCLSAASLLALGLVMLYSAAMAPKATDYMQAQIKWVGLGAVACVAMAMIDYRVWKRWNLAVVGWIVAVILLVLVLKFGVVRNNSRRWFDLGFGLFQPSEAAKIAMIIFVAWYADAYQRFMKTFWRGVVLPMALVGVGLGALVIEPDRGTTILLTAVLAVMLVLGGARWWHIVLPVALASVAMIYAIINNPMASDRLRGWHEPEKYQSTLSYQTWQSILAIGNGGTEGLGLGNGRQKMGFLPEHHTDFIFSVVAEELGLRASMAVLGCFAMFLVCGIYIAWHADNLFGFVIAAGVTFLIGLQSFINMSVVTNLLPNKGMALPFMSYGGSNLAVTMALVGLLLSVAWHREAPAHELEADDLIDPEMTTEGAR